MKTKVVNGVVYLLITEKAKEVYTSGLFEVYILLNNSVVVWAEIFSDLDDALAQGFDIGVEVDSFTNIIRGLTQ